MSEDQFQWDEGKAHSNVRKHGLDFGAASRVFDDVFALEDLDPDNESGELRYIITGIVNGVLLVVVYTERGDRIRIISARKATEHERREYYRSQTPK